jgi:hypothetical protein
METPEPDGTLEYGHATDGHYLEDAPADDWMMFDYDPEPMREYTRTIDRTDDDDD